MLLSEQRGNKWLAVERYCGVERDAKFYAADVKRLYGRLNETPRWNRASARIRELVLRSVSTS